MRLGHSLLSRAKENLARLEDEVALAVDTAYNKLERTQQMLSVSEESWRSAASRIALRWAAHLNNWCEASEATPGVEC
jgi:hypothetical protein